MKLYLSLSPDNLDSKATQLALDSNEESLKRLNQQVDKAEIFLKSWVDSNLGEMISSGWEWRCKVPADKLEGLDSVRGQMVTAMEHPLSVGVGISLADADRALMAQLLRGGDGILLFTPEVLEELKEYQEQQQKQVVSGQPMTKSEGPFIGAAFRHKTTGQIVDSGHAHDLMSLPEDDPDLEQWEDGFLDRLGNFHNRQEAHEVLKDHGLAKSELNKADETEDPQPETTAEPNKSNAGGGFTMRQQAGDEIQSPESPTTPAPQQDGSASQGEQMQALADSTSSPEGTHAASDYEDELHGHANEQDKRDQEEQEAQDGRADARKQVVDILQQVRQVAPQLEQLKDQAPELYEAFGGMIQALMLTGRSLLNTEGKDTENSPGEDSNHGEEVKKSEIEALPQQFDPEVLREATNHEMEHTQDRAVAQKTAMDHLQQDPFYYQKLKTKMDKYETGETINYPPLEPVMGKSEIPTALHNTVEGFMGGLKTLPQGPARGKYITSHMSHPPFLQALKAHPQGAVVHQKLTSYLNSPANAGFKPGGTQTVVKDELDPNLEKTGRTTGKVHVNLPVGAIKNGKEKVMDKDGSAHWVSVRDGRVLGNEGHAVSSRNPSAK